MFLTNDINIDAVTIIIIIIMLLTLPVAIKDKRTFLKNKEKGNR